MKTQLTRLLAALLFFATHHAVLAQGATITYQGWIQDNGTGTNSTEAGAHDCGG
jgi:hypothetical protein